MLFNIILATLIISLVSLLGILVTQKHIKKFLHYFISFAAGTLIAAAFFDLIPHALEELEVAGMHVEESVIFIVVGMVLFFLIERFIHWHHCDQDHCHEKPAGLLILTGDFVHNFIDGLLIAGAFLLDVTTGIITTITVAIHEIPQEFGDFAVLIHSGFSRNKALLLNFLSALSAVAGGIVGYFVLEQAENLTPYAVLITAGGFLYIALTDIVPSMHKHGKNKTIVIVETVVFLATLVGLYYLFGMMH